MSSFGVDGTGEYGTSWQGAIDNADEGDPGMIKTPSGASLICSECGTIYDNHPEVGYVPPVGDGCDSCSPEIDEDDDE